MELKICLWNWADYNNGIHNWQWFTLPNQVEELNDYMKDLQDKGREEIFICDSEHSFIGEGEDIQKVIELSQEDLDGLLREYYYNTPWYEAIPMKEFNNYTEDNTPEELINTIVFGKFNPRHNYFILNNLGNLETLDEFEYRELTKRAIHNACHEYLNA